MYIEAVMELILKIDSMPAKSIACPTIENIGEDITIRIGLL